MRNQIILTAFMVMMLCLGCKSHHDVSTADFHSYETECLGKSMDGTQTLRVWASGRNRGDATEQAKKKAVYDVTFTGISAGSGECNSFPVIDEPNARKKYEDYFDKFFVNGGAYEKYVSTKGQKTGAVQRYQGDGSQTFGIIVTVDRSALRQRFADDGILKK